MIKVYYNLKYQQNIWRNPCTLYHQKVNKLKWVKPPFVCAPIPIYCQCYVQCVLDLTRLKLSKGYKRLNTLRSLDYLQG